MQDKRDIVRLALEEGSYQERVQALKKAGMNIVRYTPYTYAVSVPPKIHAALQADLEKALEILPEPGTPHRSGTVASPIHTRSGGFLSMLQAKGRALKKKESYLHTLLVDRASQEATEEREKELYHLAGEILEVEAALDDVYGQIRAYEQEENPTELLEDRLAELKRKKRSLQASKSTYKRRMKEAGGEEKKEKFQAKIEDNKEQILSINREILALKIDLNHERS